jgi:hypothetical protein
MSINHTISEDGLVLTSSTVINNKSVDMTTTWKEVEKAERNYASAKAAAENHFKTLATNKFSDKNGATNFVKRLVKVGNVQVSAGIFKGNIYDKIRITFGNHSWVADVVDSHTQWKTFRYDALAKKGRFVVGAGGKNAAAFLSFEKNG